MDIFLTYSSLIVSGLVFGIWYGRKTRLFRWKEYLAMLILPLAGVIWLVSMFGPDILLFYGLSAVTGTLAEYFIGYAYHKTLGSMLWKYGRFAIGGYTSLLSAPFWGVAGIFFFLLAKSLSL